MLKAGSTLPFPRIKPGWEDESAYFDPGIVNPQATDPDLPVWRLIPMLQAPGHIQMAVDLWLLQQQSSGNAPPALRFYTWDPCAISLGYHQDRWPEFWQQLTWQGIPIELVRRPTGGRAVLHQGDLTYAIVISNLSGNRLQVYQKLCSFLIYGWQQLGIDLQYGKPGKAYHRQSDCFGTATGADLVLSSGTKLIGSAQLQRGRSILQHGSIRLNPHLALFRKVFGSTYIQPVEFPFKGQGETLIPKIVLALVAAARHCFGIRLHLTPLSEPEWESILELIASRNERSLVVAARTDSDLLA